MSDKKQYKALRAWGKLSGSHGDYINAQIEKARASNAPYNAIYLRWEAGEVKEWRTVDDITIIETVKKLSNELAKMMDL
jgi:hypothetical protein